MILWIPVALILAYLSAVLLVLSSELHHTPLTGIVTYDKDVVRNPELFESIVKGVFRVLLCLLASLGFTIAYLLTLAALGL